MKIEAQDPDKGPTNLIRFSFAKNLADQKKYWEEFNLDPVTGVITTRMETDHERVSIYYVSNILRSSPRDDLMKWVACPSFRRSINSCFSFSLIM